ncbi:MAG: hypothetical protein GX308_07615 [Epulopiscium sp.]|nr:hypothetical protein [Candidatus Epulonipiscium sp.]
MKKINVKQIILLLVCTILIVSAISFVYVYFKYVKIEDYMCFKGVYEFDEGKEFNALKDNLKSIDKMLLAAENDSLKLYINEETTEVAVYDKRTKEIFYSNPINRENDSIANQANKDMLSSQLAIKYYDVNRVEATMTNYRDSIALGQFIMESIENGVRIKYTLGKIESEEDSLPKFITVERLEDKVLSKLGEESVKTVKKQYIESKTNKGFLELRENAVKSKILLKQLLEAFEEAGYTKEDLAYENEASGGKQKGETAYFTIPLDYKLEGEELVVSIAANHIKESSVGKLSSIELLRYFGAGDVSEDGYMFVPNGSGSLIYFNNGKINNDAYLQQVYSLDPVVISYTQTQTIEPARLPVFGIKKDNGAVLAMIEEGDTIATICADISGKVNSYNYAYSYFTVRDYEFLSMFGATGRESDLPVVEEKMYDGNITIRYGFLAKDMANYSGMAKYYQNCLINKGILKKSGYRKLPFYLELIGGIEKRKTIAGIPYKASYPMTTFDEAGIIIDELSKMGVSNINLRYSGWFNDGYYHDVAKSVDIINKLGSKKELINVSKKIKETGGELYPDVAFQRVSYTSDSYMPAFEATRYISGITVQLSPYLRATMRMGTRFDEAAYYILSPAVLPKHVSSFIKDYTKLGIDGLSLRDLGDVIASDKKRKRPIHREFAKNIVTGQLSRLENNTHKLMIKGGNAYSLPYATDIVNLPITDNKFYIVDEEVPFYPMVIHGFIDYAGNSINLESDYERDRDILKMIECGSAPYFTWTYEETSRLKDTSLNFMYSTQYLDWVNDAKVIYEEVSRALDHLTNVSITEHIRHENGVVEIVYENGAKIYINYNDMPENISGITVEAKDYVMIGGEGK